MNFKYKSTTLNLFSLYVSIENAFQEIVSGIVNIVTVSRNASILKKNKKYPETICY